MKQKASQLPLGSMLYRFATSRCRRATLLVAILCVCLVPLIAFNRWTVSPAALVPSPQSYASLQLDPARAYAESHPSQTMGQRGVESANPGISVEGPPATATGIQGNAAGPSNDFADQSDVEPAESSAVIVDPEFQKEEDEFSRRREVYESACKTGLGGPGGEIYYYQPAKLAVCYAPEVGSTFWLRVLHFLRHDWDSGTNVTSPWDIDHYFVHRGGGQDTAPVTYTRQKALLDTFNKVLFTRDPYSRLWSAYIDKFVLPDSWMDHGRSIVARQRKDNKKGRGGPLAGGESVTSCGDDVTFGEFLDFALNMFRDAHWKPVFKICNPCAYLPQYVGKIETFASDARHILRKVGLEKLVEDYDHLRYVGDEVRMLTDYHFRRYWDQPDLHKCLSYSGLAQRLWSAFIMKGYIGKHEIFPFHEFSKLDRGGGTPEVAATVRDTAVRLMVKYHRRSGSMTAKQNAGHRRSLMAREYRQVPRALLDKMAGIFRGDFALFGYDPRPADIFVPYPKNRL